MSKHKPNLILDLDQTIISAEPLEELNLKKYSKKSEKFKYYDMDNVYRVYSRPNLQEFLDYAFKQFNVSVWTAASKDYALSIIENVILEDKRRKLDYIFFNYHCKLSRKNYKYTKKLDMLWDVYNLKNYNNKNTFIVDDYKKDVHICQPNNCIIAPPFEFTYDNSEKDNFLKQLVPELNKLKKRMKKKDKDITESINTKFS